jgi:hypothetical protein
MKTKDPMPELRKLFLKNFFQVDPPKKSRGEPRVTIAEVKGELKVTFRLPVIVKGQNFLGIYPAAATLPDADRLAVGDYALLQSGEILQIL